MTTSLSRSDSSLPVPLASARSDCSASPLSSSLPLSFRSLFPRIFLSASTCCFFSPGFGSVFDWIDEKRERRAEELRLNFESQLQFPTFPPNFTFLFSRLLCLPPLRSSPQSLLQSVLSCLGEEALHNRLKGPTACEFGLRCCSGELLCAWERTTAQLSDLMRSTQRAQSALVIALVYLFDELMYVINKVALS